jgi:DNA-binding response OmpR family regulator
MVPPGSPHATVPPVTDVLIASDAPRVVDAVRAALEGPDTTVRSVPSGRAVLPAVADATPDLIVLDQQIGSMGGMATCMELRLEETADRLDHVPVLMLLDRRPDVFLAKRSGADGWLLKPLDPIRLRRAADTLLGDGEYHDTTGTPAVSPALAAEGSGEGREVG